MLCEWGSNSYIDVDNATLDKIEAYWSQRREAANEEAKQAFDDEAYLALSDVLSDFKTARVLPQDYVRFKCRLCKKTLGSQNALRRHLGRVPQPRQGKGCVITCLEYPVSSLTCLHYSSN